MSRSQIAIVVALVAAGTTFGWAARTIFSPPPPLPEGAAFSLIDVQERELSRSINLNAVGAWTGGDQLLNQVGGVLTQRLVGSGDTVGSGDVVYTVDLAPVAVAVGEVPTFRALVPGARGADVNQLQRMLVATGHRTAAPDGLFDSATLAQLNLWQRATGQRATGSVPLGSLLFVKRLPAVVGWEDTLDGESSGGGKGVVGTRLTEGDTVARLLPATPSFSIDLPPGQRALVEPGMRVSLNLEDHSWSAQIDAIRAPREDGSAVATLAAIGDRKSICGRQCDSVAIAGDSSVRARITVLAPESGPVIPTAALVVGPDGSTAVVTDGGETVAVSVLATSGGQALIEGVVAGTKLRVPGDVETTQ